MSFTSIRVQRIERFERRLDQPNTIFKLTIKDTLPVLLGNGFLGTRATWVLDAILVSTLLVVAVMSVSIALVKFGRKYKTHRNIQTSLAVLLFVAVVAFEIEIRLFTNWRELAQPSPYYATGWVGTALWVHLLFAIPTPFIWFATIWTAIRWFRPNLGPNEHSSKHKILGRMAAGSMMLTTVTAWIFYYVAFVTN